ncbi:hypothetical protein Btru_066343 [Bulinus truncatus]|nr:hypothetical protein Btru_066343 [Bulinus truncatus]
MTTQYTNMANTTNTTPYDLDQLNNARAMVMLPTLLVFGTYIIVGLIGNTLAVYIFSFRLKSGTQNILIVYLAVFDLLTCSLAVPFEMTDLVFSAWYPSLAGCKLMRFTNTFCTAGSIFTLIIIAVDRYRKICRPLKKQMSARDVKLSLIPVLVCATIYSVPAFWVYGFRTLQTEIPGLRGRDCSTPDVLSDSRIPLIYNLFLSASFVVLTSVLWVIYFKIYRVTKRRGQTMKKYSQASPGSTSQSNEMTSSTGTDNTMTESVSPAVFDCIKSPVISFVNQSESVLVSEIKGHNSSDPPPVSLTSCSYSLSLDDTVDTQMKVFSPTMQKLDDVKCSNDTKIKGKQRPSLNKGPRCESTNEKRIKNKTTIIAFVVTVVFVLSFLPHFSLQVAKKSNMLHDYKLTGGVLVVYNIFTRSYFINSISNPFIYGVLNSQFCSEAKKVIRNLCCKTVKKNLQ